MAMPSPTFPFNLPAGTSSAPLAIVTHPTPTLWVIELRHGADNRITTHLLLDVLTPALDAVEQDWRATRGPEEGARWAPGALVIIGALDQDKFFSNGLDYLAAIQSEIFFPRIFHPVLTRLMSFPIPTIAALNGHTFAGGMLLALSCDYRVMTSGKAWCSMNEIHFGAPITACTAEILRAKIRSPNVLRACILEGRRFTPQDALANGLVDEIVDGKSADILHKAGEFARRVEGCAVTGVWGIMKKSIYPRVFETATEFAHRMTPNEQQAIFQAKL
ncbi:hypothetical protein BOTBODRAFT_31897 [Botryobasidium botryosum FD-172 SS1]|uniref:Enoyl-CoA hydratase n=1 Tax=Botryobasidium botryosum (strain FD-172 SS1) TaxID=930990 RepID=A0A067MI77_BOTB1|nr:hypothetical protein BOTBODRAFT_31897 [Botryobasidium botryosum FD-172 SS1]